ncbi:MAG TPA: hypothetical protein DCL54_07655, partial [Alphaproteobacteria bacterium]|nr:hypothetical protein [Alphaproteobacteria bacterium]
MAALLRRADGVENVLDYEASLLDAINAVKREGRYRVFADIVRQRGDFPTAVHYTPQGPKTVTVWCSND